MNSIRTAKRTLDCSSCTHIITAGEHYHWFDWRIYCAECWDYRMGIFDQLVKDFPHLFPISANKGTKDDNPVSR